MSHKVHAEVWPGGAGLLDFDPAIHVHAVSFDSPEDAYDVARGVIYAATGDLHPVIDIEWDEL